jgi:hypothetical protein
VHSVLYSHLEGLYFFGGENIGAKAALKMLVKLTPMVDFTNILRVAFSYKSFARNFFVLEVKLKLFISAWKLAQMGL